MTSPARVRPAREVDSVVTVAPHDVLRGDRVVVDPQSRASFHIASVNTAGTPPYTVTWLTDTQGVVYQVSGQADLIWTGHDDLGPAPAE